MGKKHIKILRLIVAVATLLLLGVGCQQASQEIGELPTIMVLPSATPTLTPTLTSTPTSTPTPTLTPTPTSTLTPTNTLTFTPSATFTASITSTFTITPTFTNTPTSTATNTPPATATPNLPQILSFATSATTVPANASVTLTWNGIGDTARIDQLNQQGAVVQTFTVVTVGQLPVTVPGNLGKLVVYRLAVQRGRQEVTASLAITIQCTVSWFFGDQYAPPNSGCPQGSSMVARARFQQFERGYAIYLYLPTSGIDTVYGLVSTDSRFITYPMTWDRATAYNCVGSSPSGKYAPKTVFDWMFCNTNAPVGSWSSALGWGVTDLNGDDRTIQFEESTGAFYIDSPVGVFRFNGPSPNTWSKIK